MQTCVLSSLTLSLPHWARRCGDWLGEAEIKLTATCDDLTQLIKTKQQKLRTYLITHLYKEHVYKQRLYIGTHSMQCVNSMVRMNLCIVQCLLIKTSNYI